MPETMDEAKKKWGFCFDDNEERVRAAIEGFGLPAAVGLIAAQMADAFEAGFAAADGAADAEHQAFMQEIDEMTGPGGEIYGHR